MSFPPVPPEVKGIAHFLKAAEEHDNRNIVVSYWCRMYACSVAMKIVPGKKPPDVSALLIALMDWLEKTKKSHADTDGICNETAAQAIIEEYAIQLFKYADEQDQAEHFNKNVVKAFYTAGILMDVLQQFGELSDDIFHKRKYAKWKAAYIHNCLKFGDTPIPGPPRDGQDDDLIHKSELDNKTDTSSDQNSNAGFFVPPPNQQTPNLPDIPTTSGGTSPAIPTNPTPPNYGVVAPTPTPAAIIPPAPSVMTAASNISLTPVQIEKAQKYCKYASSALNYDDIKTAVDNLQKALNLLQYGQDV